MTEPNRQSGEKEERIIEIEIERLRPFKEHPFQVKDDKEMFLLQESIEKYGILNPLIVRPVPDGYYEIISGHRRKHAAEKLGYRKVPVIIRVLSEDDSILSMVDSNLHRERISYSEKAFAYVDESAEASKVETTQTDQSTDKEEKKDEAASTNEVLPEDGTDQGTAFTTPGNGEVKDDITDDSTKEFLTVTTKNNNTFYIVIDRSATSQNVYMLSQIDENDLSEFLDKDSTATVVTPQPDTSKVVLDETNNEDVDKEATVDPEKTASTKTNMGTMATILILALGGVAAYYYFKIYKPKKEEDEDDQPEGLETGGLEEVPDEEESEDEDFEENEK